jgi:hypothetical protein
VISCYYKLEIKQRSLRIEFANAGGNSVTQQARHGVTDAH